MYYISQEIDNDTLYIREHIEELYLDVDLRAVVA